MIDIAREPTHGEVYFVMIRIDMRKSGSVSQRRAKMKQKKSVTVLGAGYSGLTTAAELTLRGFKVDVVAKDLGYRPPLTIVGTQVLFRLILCMEPKWDKISQNGECLSPML